VKVDLKMNYTKYRTTSEIQHVLSLLEDMWEANNHLSLSGLLSTIAQHKGVEFKRLSDQQLQGYIIDALEGKFDKNPT
tara:strand:- start:137 stop:370 length:234 start_codon:yes stop_codon:yes gene_type:complete